MHPKTATPPSQELLEQTERILASKSFSGSETMRHLLRYLAHHTVDFPDQIPKEHEIAVELLGRTADFDPKIDPVVRVQSSRLRSKLAEYYVAEGAEDRVFLEVPKGSYCLQASYRATPGGPAAAAPVRHRRLLWAGVGMAVLALAVAGFWKLSALPGDVRLGPFWRPFLDSSKEPLVVFANPKFVGSSSSSLRLFDPEKDNAAVINPGYAGAGEVMGASALTQTFASFGRRIRLKRSQIFSWDDANAYNLIFLGAPPHNVSLFQVPLGLKLKFKPYAQEPRKNEGCIQNLEPKPGEEQYYCASSEGPTTIEYALVTLSPGEDQSRVVLVIAGTTTFGTQAAAEYVCDPARVPAILAALGARSGQPLPPFDALLRCRIRGGVPVAAELVLVKK